MGKLQEKLTAIKEQLDKNDNNRPDANSELGIAKAKLTRRRLSRAACSRSLEGDRTQRGAPSVALTTCGRGRRRATAVTPCRSWGSQSASLSERQLGGVGWRGRGRDGGAQAVQACQQPTLLRVCRRSATSTTRSAPRRAAPAAAGPRHAPAYRAAGAALPLPPGLPRVSRLAPRPLASPAPAAPQLHARAPLRAQVGLGPRSSARSGPRRPLAPSPRLRPRPPPPRRCVARRLRPPPPLSPRRAPPPRRPSSSWSTSSRRRRCRSRRTRRSWRSQSVRQGNSRRRRPAVGGRRRGAGEKEGGGGRRAGCGGMGSSGAQWW